MRFQQTPARAQSESLGFVLMVAVIITVSTIIVGSGVIAINNIQGDLSQDRAENSLAQTSSQANTVALGAEDSKRLSLPDTQNNYHVNENAGRMTVRHHTDTTETLVQTNLGAVIYDGTDGETVAYQGGGVWQTHTTGGSSMLSPPEFHYREQTLTLPIITITGNGRVSDKASVTHNNSESIYPGVNGQNPVTEGKISIIVESEYYEGWGEYFEQRTDGTVDYPAENTVRLNLTTPVRDTDGTVAGAIVSTSGASFVELKAKSTVDSYDSSSGDYSTTGGNSNGDIYIAGELDLKNNAEVDGSIVIEDTLYLRTNSRIRGDLTHGGDIPADAPSHVDGTVSPGATVSDLAPVDDRIEDKLTAFAANNDNSSHASDIVDIENGNNCNPCTLSAGDYYLDDFDASGTIRLEPNGGVIEVAVGNDFNVQNSATVEVIGDGRVNFYVEDEADIQNSGEVINNGDNADQFWLYMNSDESFDNKKGTLTGVVYGPQNPEEGTTGVKINVKQDSDIYGALVGEIENIDNDADIHYDSALNDATGVDLGGDTVPDVTYLHISTNDIGIEDS